MPPLDTPARLASRGGESVRSQLARMADQVLTRRRATVLLFIDPKDGKFREGAVEWLEQIGKRNFLRGTTFVPGDRDQTLINEGRRQAIQELYDEVLLDGERIDEINAQIREIERDGR